MGEHCETTAGRSGKKLGAHGRMRQPVGVGNATGAKKPHVEARKPSFQMAVKTRQRVATGKGDLAAHGRRPLSDHWPATHQMEVSHPRESNGVGDRRDCANIDY